MLIYDTSRLETTRGLKSKLYSIFKSSGLLLDSGQVDAVWLHQGLYWRANSKMPRSIWIRQKIYFWSKHDFIMNFLQHFAINQIWSEKLKRKYYNLAWGTKWGEFWNKISIILFPVLTISKLTSNINMSAMVVFASERSNYKNNKQYL